MILRLLLVLGIVVSADASAQAHAFPVSDDALRAAVCPARGACVIDAVVDAGHHGATDLAVVRVRAGRRVCVDEAGYRDYLVSVRGGVVRRERLLVRGECPCLEWSRSRWIYRGGELRFTYGPMGAPGGSGDDTRPTTLHVRPWPLAITGCDRADEHVVAPETPARGPFVVLTME